MMKMVLKNETLNRISAIISGMVSEAKYVRIDFGTGVADKDDGMLNNKMVISSSASQLEVGFIGCVEEIPEGISMEKPYKTYGFDAAEFGKILNTLAGFECDMEIVLNPTGITMNVGNAEMGVYAVDSDLLLPVIKNKNNSPVISAWDKDIAIIHASNKELASFYALAGSLSARIADGSYMCRLKDSGNKYAEVSTIVKGPDGKEQEVIKKALVSNAELSMMIAEESHAFSYATMGVALKKGIAKNMLKSFMSDEEIEKAIPCILSVEEGENGEMKPKLTSYLDYKKDYDEKQKLQAGEDELYFGIGKNSFARIVQLAGIEKEDVFLSIGEKYITATLGRIGVVYTVPRTPLAGNQIFSLLARFETKYKENDTYVSVSADDLAKATKLQALKSELRYGSDGLKNPVALTFKKDGIEMAFLDAISKVPVTEANTKIESLDFGINLAYLKVATAAFKKNIRIYYGGKELLEHAILVTDASLSAGNGLVLCGVVDIEKTRANLESKKNKGKESEE